MQDDERRRVEAVGRTNLDITERKRAEEAVRSSEEQLRLALKGANAAAWKWNIETGEATWSPEMYVLHGRDPETVPPSYDEWLASVHPEDRERVRANVRNALESGGSAYGSEYRVQLLSGEIRWIIALGTIERSREGAPLRMSGIEHHRQEAGRTRAPDERDRAAAEPGAHALCGRCGSVNLRRVRFPRWPRGCS